MSTEKFVYLDNINTTPPAPEVIEIMIDTMKSRLGNPSSHIHSAGIAASKIMDEARASVARFINCSPDDIIFTSGATESNNLGITGFLKANPDYSFICSNIEHFSVLNQAGSRKRNGADIEILKVDEYGLLDIRELESAVKKKRALVSIALANPEIGTVQDIEEISRVCHKNRAVLHTDTTACAGLLPIDVRKFGADLLTLSAHNIHGPAGVGALYTGKNIRVASIFEGGNQENGIRPGTENIAGIAGFGEACRIGAVEIRGDAERLAGFGSDLWKILKKTIPFIRFTGHPEKRLPGHVSFWVEHIEGESLLLLLSMNGVMASSGSACSSNLKAKDEDELMASHVLDAVGVPSDICSGSITLSGGRYNSKEDYDYVGSLLPGLVQKLLAMSPSYDDFMRKEETPDG